MIKFSVPTNWQEDLIPAIKKELVEELYGQLTSDFIGGGRASYALPQISRKTAASHIKEAHANKIKFAYLLNATCFNNKEWTRSGQRKIHQLLYWLMDIGVDSVVVTAPYLLELIKKKYPKLRVCVSTLAGVNSIERARYWQDLGADEIGLFGPEVNRDFSLLKEIRKSIRCRLTVIPNNGCLYRCPFFIYHGVLTSHASQKNHYSQGFMIDYCRLSCDYRKILEPMNFIRADWIRPEDLHYYEEIGIDKFKFVDRSMTTEKIRLIVEAYVRRSYEGNLLDLLPFPSQSIASLSLSFFHKFKYFFRPFSINLFKLSKMKNPLGLNMKIHIENRKLDGFIKKFLKENCNLRSCKECGYCERISREVISIDSEYYRMTLKNYQDFLEDIISGEIFKII